MQDIQKQDDNRIATIENVLVNGDLSALTSEQRLLYVRKFCEKRNLNMDTRPIQFIKLGGRLTVYATKDCSEQLRRNNKISLKIIDKNVIGDVYVVTCAAELPDGRRDEDIGTVSIGGLRGDNLANATMKAVTKAKRRATLSICGLGLLDETELETIPGKEYFRESTTTSPQTPSLVNEEKHSKQQKTDVKSQTSSVNDTTAVKKQLLADAFKDAVNNSWGKQDVVALMEDYFKKENSMDLTEQEITKLRELVNREIPDGKNANAMIRVFLDELKPKKKVTKKKDKLELKG